MMSPRVLLRLGTRGLLVHKLRSILSILGIVFGVAAVLAMSSVGEGARREALAQIGALGIDSVTLRARPAAGAEARSQGLRLRDAEAVATVVPHVVAVAPVRQAAVEAEAGSRVSPATAVGTTPAYREAARLTLSAGRFVGAIDVREAKRVVVLGSLVARDLFPLGEALGQTVRVGGDFYSVVGILEARARSQGKAGPIRLLDVNRALFVPLPALDRGQDTRPDGIEEIVLRVDRAEAVVAAAEAARTVVRRTSGDAPFDLIVPQEILRQKERTQRIFNVVTGAVAALSLLVGGIGIMNIMLASVAERTGEVGIRRALGATRHDVAAQFLVESSLLTFTGGLLGAVLGILGAFLIQRWAGWPTALSPVMLLVSLVVALLVGIGFGFYPAWLAAQLEPMEALRRE